MTVLTKFTLEQYEKMMDAGVFAGPDQRRLELIRGEIVPMSPIGTPHWRMVNILNRWSAKVTSEDDVEISVQNPITVPPNDSAPEPDIAWLKAKPYTSHVRPEDILLVIEVADSTVRFDTVEKAAIYAEGGIKDYWVVDLASEVVHVHRDPIDGQYRTITMARKDDEILPLEYPQAVLNVGEAFGKL